MKQTRLRHFSYHGYAARFYVCAHAHGLSLRLRDSSTCGAVPERSEGMSREDGEVRIARRWRRSETKPTAEAPEIYSVLRCPAVLFLTIQHYSTKNGVLRKNNFSFWTELYGIYKNYKRKHSLGAHLLRHVWKTEPC